MISDIELPVGTGLELIRELKSKGIRGIASSGYGSEEDVKNSRAAGFALHLVKPVLADALDEAICRVTTIDRVRLQGANSTYIEPMIVGEVKDESDRLSSVTMGQRQTGRI